MKATDLPKDKQTSLRVSLEIEKMIKDDGYSIQSFFDKAVNEKYKITLEYKEQKSREN